MENDFYKKIGELMRRERRIKEYSQEYMAVKLGISQSAYHKIENGKTHCSAFIFMCVFQILDIPKNELFLIFFDHYEIASERNILRSYKI